MDNADLIKQDEDLETAEQQKSQCRRKEAAARLLSSRYPAVAIDWRREDLYER